MKKKTITLVIYMLVCISLVSVGFAAWIITGGTSTEATAGIQASKVTDKSLNIINEKWTQNDVDTNTPSIVFGVPTGARLQTSDWLRFEDVPEEKLEATYSFTLNVGDGTANDAKLSEVFKIDGSSVEFGIDQQFTTYLDEAVRGEYLLGPVVTYFVGDQEITDNEQDGTKDDFFEAIKAVNDSKVNIKIEIEFSWGKNSNFINPYSYFNTIATPSVDQKTVAKNCLNAAYALNGATYTLSIVLDAVKA